MTRRSWLPQLDMLETQAAPIQHLTAKNDNHM